MTNRETVQKFISDFEQGNTDNLLEYLADDIVWNMIGDQILSGKSEIKEMMGGLTFQGAPDFKTGMLLDAGDYVIHTHRVYAVFENGESFKRQWCNIYRFLDDKISYIESYPADLTDEHLDIARRRNVLLYIIFCTGNKHNTTTLAPDLSH